MANIPGCCQAEWVDDRVYEMLNSEEYDITVISATHCFRYAKKIKHYRIPSILPFEAFSEYNEINQMNIDISTRPFLMTYLKFMTFIYKFFKNFNFKFFRGEGRWFWFFPSFILLLFLTLRNRYDFIYSTGGPASPHISNVLVSRLLNIKSIIELQDPLSGDDIGRNNFSRKALSIIESFLVKYSRNIVYATKSAMESAKNKYPKFEDKIDFIYPGAKRNIFISSKNKKQKITFSYIGSLYQTRNLDVFLDALDKLKLKDEQDYIINLYGWIAEDVKARILSRKNKKIKFFGMISREQAHIEALNSDVLLLIQHTDARSILTIPFKIYDYLNTGNLILGLTYKNKEIDTILKDHSHIYCSAISVDEVSMKINLIMNNLSEMRKNIKPSNLNPKNAVLKMEKIIS